MNNKHIDISCSICNIAFQITYANYNKKSNRNRTDWKCKSCMLKERSLLYKTKWNSIPDDIKMQRTRGIRNHSKEFWDNSSNEEKQQRLTKLQMGNKRKWDNMTEEENLQWRLKCAESQKNGYWGNLTEEQKINHRKILKTWWDSLDSNEKIKRYNDAVKKSKGMNSLHQKFELYFSKSYISNQFYFVSEVILENDSNMHFWDYGIYDKKTNTLQMVVDLDGDKFHGDKNDYDGISNGNIYYDERRFLSISDGIKYCIIYSFQFSKSFEELIKLIVLEYDEFVTQQFQYCRSIEFPYPSYTDQELINSYKQLLDLRWGHRRLSISTNTRIGDRVILHFHHSIYHARVGKYPSPYEAWHDDDLLRKVIQNRIIYASNLNPNKILQGFNISKIAPKVSVFSAGRAKLLVNKYLPNANEIFDPFSGFSGRMLGTISLGKKYIGQDISNVTLKHSSEIIEFLKQHYDLPHISLSEKDILTSHGAYESLFTCPPYSDKETWHYVDKSKYSCDDWIDICLKHFKCKRYLFVIDHTEKYKEYIVDEIINKSHFNTNNEYVVLIDKGS